MSAGGSARCVGAALARAGHHVVAASGVSRASVRRAEALLPDVPLLPPDEVAPRSDLVLLAVPDDALAGLVRGLVGDGFASRRPDRGAHLGAHGVDVLRPAADVGVLPLALHPAMTFTGRPEDLPALVSCCVGVTANQDDGRLERRRGAGGGDGRGAGAGARGGPPALSRGADPRRQPPGHAGPECVDTVAQRGLSPAERVIAPLLSAALDNALRHGDRALTGPVARGDVGTVRKHVPCSREASPDTVAPPGAGPPHRAPGRRAAGRAAARRHVPEPLSTCSTRRAEENCET